MDADEKSLLGAYRAGELLVVRKGGCLPPFCVKCGELCEPDAPLRLKMCAYASPWRAVRWLGILGASVPPLIFQLLRLDRAYALPAQFLGFVFWLLSLSGRMVLEPAIPFCEKHRQNYDTARTLGAFLFVGGLVAFAILTKAKAPPFFILAALAFVFSGAIVYPWQFRATKVEPEYIIFTGASETFLSRLPSGQVPCES